MEVLALPFRIIFKTAENPTNVTPSAQIYVLSFESFKEISIIFIIIQVTGR